MLQDLERFWNTGTQTNRDGRLFSEEKHFEGRLAAFFTAAGGIFPVEYISDILYNYG